MTSGLSQVCKQWFGVRIGMLSIKRLATKNPHDSQLCWVSTNSKVGLTAPAYHKKEGAAPHPAACKFSLLYNGKPDGSLGVRVGT